MKGKHFYSHLIEIHEIYLSISEIDLSDEERGHLMSLTEANIHATVLNAVLPELSNEEKKVFLKNLLADDHDKTWKHLLSRVKNVEETINKSLKDLKKELLKDIEEARKS
jgi:hypothetical protein